MAIRVLIVFRISALSGAGVTRIMGRAAQVLTEEGESRAEHIPAESEPAEKPKRLLRVERLDSGRYAVTGDDVERAVVMTDLANEDAVRYLHRHLERIGVIHRLRDLGAQDGDKVTIGAIELDFID